LDIDELYSYEGSAGGLELLGAPGVPMLGELELTDVLVVVEAPA
jgi:hypothetical protein